MYSVEEQRERTNNEMIKSGFEYSAKYHCTVFLMSNGEDVSFIDANADPCNFGFYEKGGYWKAQIIEDGHVVEA